MATDFDTYERDLWAGRAAAYERAFAKLTAHTADALLDAVRAGEGTVLLDVGTGPGVVAGRAARRGARVRAVDAEAEMVETAARNVPGLDVRVAMLPDLPFEDASFEAVVGNFVINHIGEPAAALRDLRRLLGLGGRLALTCWVMPGSGALGIVRDAIERAEVPWPDDIPQSPFMEYGQRDAFGELLAGAGFADVAVEELDWEHTVDPEQWWTDGALAKVGTNGVIVSRQDPATVARIKQEFDRLVEPYATGDGRVALPAHALLARGRC